MLTSKSITLFLGIWHEGTEPVRSVLLVSGKTAVNEEKVLRAIARPRSSAFTAKACLNHHQTFPPLRVTYGDRRVV